MLTSIELINFKNHQHTRIEGLGRLATMVGPNGAGKSSVLQATQLIFDLGRGTNAAAIRYPSKSDPHLAERVRLTQPGFQVSASGLSSGQSWRAEIAFPRAAGLWPRHVCFSSNEAELEDVDFEDDAVVSNSDLRRVLSGATHLRLEPSKLRKSSYPEVLPPDLRIDGQGLASVVSYLMGFAPDLFQKLVEQLRMLVPSVQSLRINRVPIKRQRTQVVTVDGQTRAIQLDEEVVGEQLLFDTDDGIGIPGHLQSDGTLSVLALLCALLHPAAPKTLLIDDIETGLHPRAQRTLMGLLRNMLEQDAELQVLLVTHSRYIVDGCRPEEVWVMGLGDHGPKVAQLDEHPSAFDALPMLTTGEFWGSEGEAWLQHRG